MANISANSSLALHDLQNETETTPVPLSHESTALELDLWASMVKNGLYFFLYNINSDPINLGPCTINCWLKFVSHLQSTDTQIVGYESNVTHQAPIDHS